MVIVALAGAVLSAPASVQAGQVAIGDITMITGDPDANIDNGGADEAFGSLLRRTFSFDTSSSVSITFRYMFLTSQGRGPDPTNNDIFRVRVFREGVEQTDRQVDGAVFTPGYSGDFSSFDFANSVVDLNGNGTFNEMAGGPPAGDQVDSDFDGLALENAPHVDKFLMALKTTDDLDGVPGADEPNGFMVRAGYAQGGFGWQQVTIAVDNASNFALEFLVAGDGSDFTGLAIDRVTIVQSVGGGSPEVFDNLGFENGDLSGWNSGGNIVLGEVGVFSSLRDQSGTVPMLDPSEGEFFALLGVGKDTDEPLVGGEPPVIPEPASLAVLGLGAGVLAMRRRRGSIAAA